MLKRHQIVFGFLLATAVWCLVIALSTGTSAHHQICETDQYGRQYCTTHNIFYVFFWYLGYLINAATISALATAFIAWFTWTLRGSTEKLWLASERHSERELRPYVVCDSAEVVKLEGGHRIECRIGIRNTGQTPAIDARALFALTVVPRLQEDQTLTLTPGQRYVRFILGPGQLRGLPTLGDETPLSQADFDAIQNGSKQLFAIGEIRYSDFIRTNHQRVTTVRLVFNPRNKTLVFDAAGNAMT
jgi:hypothetical protein